MKNIRIGVLCPSEIAFRRFMPAVQKQENLEYVGVGCANKQEWFGNNDVVSDYTVLEKEMEKANSFTKLYGGRVFESYNQLLTSQDIDAVYLPLPPALHYKWGKAALEHGKHLLMEKPFTTRLIHTEELVSAAQSKGLVLHENYMFQYHSQLDFIRQTVDKGDIGEIRLIRITFGFPFRSVSDFRYNKELGGGALLDCGGYTIKLAALLLGQSAKITTSQLNFKDNFDVDIYGSATMKNDNGLTAQLSFGMDNSYKCELEIWGSTGSLYTNRILTAPEGFEPVVVVKTADGERTYNLPADDSFAKSIVAFKGQIEEPVKRNLSYEAISKQAKLMADFCGV